MSDFLPPVVHESTSNPSSAPDRDYSPSCPFCTIARSYEAISPTASSDALASQLEPEKLDPPSFVLYSSDHVVAFLDIMPLTRGHVLVAPRKHRIKVGDLTPDEGAEIGRVLPILARSVLKAVLPDIPHGDADYNVVQNNGPGAAQVVPHVHFHIVPRPPLNYKYPRSNTPTPSSRKRYPPNHQPAGRQAVAITFGRGVRQDLDYDEAQELAEAMRVAVREEWYATFRDANGQDGAAQKASGKSAAQSSGDADGNGRRGAWKV